jgi:hypothetical protein
MPKKTTNELTGDGTGQPLPPADGKGGPRTTPATTSGGDGSRVVQLTRNAAGHQVGETFRADEAERLGILDLCRPFAA